MSQHDHELHRREEFEKRVNAKLAIISILLLASICTLAAVYFYACSVGPQDQVVSAPPPASCSNPTGANGDTNPLTCPAGQTGQLTQVCVNGTWQTGVNTCTGGGNNTCSVPTWSDVAPIFQQYCVSCHSVLSSYSGLSGMTEGTAGIATRMASSQNTTNHMPQAGSTQVCVPPNDANDPTQPTSCTKEQLVQSWISAGANNTCPGSGPGPGPGTNTGFIDEDTLLNAAIQDATNLNSSDRPFIFYLTDAGAINNGLTGAALQAYIDAMNKGLNSLNTVSQTQVAAVKVATGLWRIDERNYFPINPQQSFNAIVAADTLNIVDNTSKGQILQALLGKKNTYFQVDDFMDTTFRNSGVYYQLTNVPSQLEQYEAQVGVNLNNDLATLPNVSATGQAQISFLGNIGTITEQKTRLILRDSQARTSNGTGYWYQTFDVARNTGNTTAGSATVSAINSFLGLVVGQTVTDGNNAFAPGTTILTLNQANDTITISKPAVLSVVGDIIFPPNQNLFNDPLLAGTGAKLSGGASFANFNPVASEVIVQNPNGTQTYSLWNNANGQRLNFADPNVVIDTETPLANHVISVGITCLRCHNGGIITMNDAVLASVTANADQFTTNDVLLVDAVYHKAATNTAMYNNDIAQYNATLNAVGVKPGADPQNQIGDIFQGNWSVQQLAGELFLTPDQLKQCINQSAATKAAIGEIESATAPANEVFAALPGLIAGCHLFQDLIAQ